MGHLLQRQLLIDFAIDEDPLYQLVPRAHVYNIRRIFEKEKEKERKKSTKNVLFV